MKENVTEIITQIEKHRDAVGAERDRLDSFIDELSALRDTCEKAWDDLQRARDALSEQA